MRECKGVLRLGSRCIQWDGALKITINCLIGVGGGSNLCWSLGRSRWAFAKTKGHRSLGCRLRRDAGLDTIQVERPFEIHMPRPLRIVMWIGIALLGALAVATIALRRGEQINAMWLVVAAFCSFALGYRFYSKFISAKVLALDEQRATPAERLENGRDFVPTNKWVVFGHHFAAIAGPGPLVGPVLAAQFGYLPGTLWVLAGAVFGGCVQDFVILLFSVRRDGKSLCQMAKEEIGTIGGLVAFIAVLSIIVILLAVVALVIVNALKSSPWGTFTIAMTIPIALLMGVYLRRIRPGKVLETSLLGFVLVMLAVFGGQWVSQAPSAARI